MWTKGNKGTGKFNKMKKIGTRNSSVYAPLIKIQYVVIFLRAILEKWARRMTAFTEQKSKKTLICYLVLFNVLFLVALSSQIVPVFNLSKSEDHMISIEKGASKQLTKRDPPAISEFPKGKKEEKIENFVLYLDFLEKDSIAKKRYDSISNSHPGLLESLMLSQEY